MALHLNGYSNFHEINLDWLIAEITKWAQDYAIIHDETVGMLAQIEELKEYVDNYFDDLDIQAEVNAKIDELVENGTFEEIVGEYMETVKQDMVSDSYYKEITYRQIRRNDTTVYIIDVPRTDTDNNVIQFDIENDSNNSPSVHARKTYSTLTTNGQLYMKPAVSGGSWLTGNIISRGEIKNQQDVTVPLVSEGIGYLTFSENRLVVKEFPISTPMITLMSDSDVYTCFNFYAKIVDNGNVVDISNLVSNEGASLALADINFAIGVKDTGNIVFVGCDGRNPIDKGLTAPELSAIFIEEGCTRAWMLDGGGSTSINYFGAKINKSYDGEWNDDRLITWTLNFRKNEIDKSIAEAVSIAGDDKFISDKVTMPMIKNLFDRYKTSGGDLDNVKTTCFKYIINAVHAPTPNDDGTLIVISREGAGQNFNDPEDIQQFWISSVQPQFVYSRHAEYGVWGDWALIYGVEKNKVYNVDKCDVAGIMDGNKIYFTIPISPVTERKYNTTFRWGNGNVIIYYNGYELANSGQGRQFTMGYCHLIENVGAVCRMDCGTDLTNDTHYKNKAVCLLEFTSVFIDA